MAMSYFPGLVILKICILNYLCHNISTKMPLQVRFGTLLVGRLDSLQKTMGESVISTSQAVTLISNA